MSCAWVRGEPPIGTVAGSQLLIGRPPPSSTYSTSMPRQAGLLEVAACAKPEVA